MYTGGYDCRDDEKKWHDMPGGIKPLCLLLFIHSLRTTGDKLALAIGVDRKGIRNKLCGSEAVPIFPELLLTQTPAISIFGSIFIQDVRTKKKYGV